MTLNITTTDARARARRVAQSRPLLAIGQPAGLDFGDRIADLLAMDKGEPMLFKGGGFARTEVPMA
jgi:ribonuclease VapC